MSVFVLMLVLPLVAVALLVWCLSDSRRAAGTSRRPWLEYLPDRVCPATALWNGPDGGAWADKNNWTWWGGNGLQGFNYPGDTEDRFDDVSLGKQANCTLSVGLAERLNSLKLDAQYANKTLTLNGDVKVGSGGFTEEAGTLSVGAGKTLELDFGTHTWKGGAIDGPGTVKVFEGKLTVSDAAASMKADLVITGTQADDGIVYLGGLGGANPMAGNLDLDGVGRIDVQNKGHLALRQDVSAADAFAKGGIVGGACSQITVSVGGMMTRGFAGNGVGGKVLVDVPVKIHGGTFKVFRQSGGVGEQQKDVIKFGSAFAYGDEYGYGLALTATTSKFIQDLSTEVIATHGVLVNGATGGSGIPTYEVTVGEGLGQTLTGDLTFGTARGRLILLDAVNGVTGEFAITGDLRQTSTSLTELNWTATSADRISVSKDAYLAGTLRVSGTGPAQNEELLVVTAHEVKSDFSSLDWVVGFPPNGEAGILGIRCGDTYSIYWNEEPDAGGGIELP